jgi:hypothetical protein
MDSFGYTIFVFVPILALVVGGIAWVVQTRANRRIDALLSSDRTAGATNSTVFDAGPVGLSGNAYVVKSSTITAQFKEAAHSE